MILTWWRRRRRSRILQQPFPGAWKRVLERNVRQYGALDNQGRERLRRLVQVFVAEKYWEAAGGIRITDEIKVTIAGRACLLLLGFDDEYFDNLQTVLVYPSQYVARQTDLQPGGIVTESMSLRLGEAWHRGPVVLAWSSVRTDGHGGKRGHNVVLHEFAHVLDMGDDTFDGTPVFGGSVEGRTWHDVMTAEYRRLMRDAERGRATLLDHYGAVSPAEFFAVATECFFEQPVEMRQRHGELYRVMCGFYRQDPAEWDASDGGQ